MIFCLPLVSTEVLAGAEGAHRSQSRPRQPRNSGMCSKVFLQRLQIQSSIPRYLCAERCLTGRQSDRTKAMSLPPTDDNGGSTIFSHPGPVPWGSCCSPWFKRIFISAFTSIKNNGWIDHLVQPLGHGVMSHDQMLREAFPPFWIRAVWISQSRRNYLVRTSGKAPVPSFFVSLEPIFRRKILFI